MSKQRRRRKVRLPQEPVAAHIEELSAEGRGVAHIDGKVTFIDFALPGEDVLFKYSRTSSKFDEGQAIEVLKASAQRVEPACEHFGICGGCSLQHLNETDQIEAKQQTLLNHFQHLSGVEPGEIMPPLTGPVLGYRHKARLGVKYVAKKGKVLVGFREKAAPYIANLDSCKVLHPSVGERLDKLSELIMSMEARQTIPQIEVAVSDDVTALIFRHLEDLSATDREKLIQFAQAENIQIALQPGGINTVKALWPENPPPLFYRLENQQVKIEFQATDFTQVNPVINQAMIDHALALLDLQVDDSVLDLFCGLGNFTLPMARQAARVTGVEGAEVMVVKARENARLNDINNVDFFAADLSQDLKGQPWLQQKYDKILLDPPRSGAMEMLNYLGKLGASRIVYVSCHPATLARDAKILVNDFGYRLTRAGVMDMFPHTAHVESIAVFDLKDKSRSATKH
ncbi:MAG: 23S rRNA (uracil(1939)-C(5))-methyltransferase RlmD [Gammaproteobacteria bacterium]|nr:23S rRNA (uracil(1939)-C(5))-methyltransferase RlmD [Gammaproteobacteria bacterium]